MNDKEYLRLVKSIQNSMRCHVCGKKFPETNIKYLGQLDVMIFLRLKCASCQAQALATITTDQNTAIYDNIDMTENLEVIQESNEPRVTFDDVLDLHTDLQAATSNPEAWLSKL